MSDQNKLEALVQRAVDGGWAEWKPQINSILFNHDFTIARQKLHSRIAKAHAERNQSKIGFDTIECEHEWDRYRQTLEPSNNNYIGGRAYFIVKACSKCRKKLTINYVQER